MKIKEEATKKARELGLHLGYANKSEEYLNWWLSKIQTLLQEIKGEIEESIEEEYFSRNTVLDIINKYIKQ